MTTTTETEIEHDVVLCDLDGTGEAGPDHELVDEILSAVTPVVHEQVHQFLLANPNLKQEDVVVRVLGTKGEVNVMVDLAERDQWLAKAKAICAGEGATALDVGLLTSLSVPAAPGFVKALVLLRDMACDTFSMTTLDLKVVCHVTAEIPQA